MSLKRLRGIGLGIFMLKSHNVSIKWYPKTFWKFLDLLDIIIVIFLDLSAVYVSGCELFPLVDQ